MKGGEIKIYMEKEYNIKKITPRQPIRPKKNHFNLTKWILTILGLLVLGTLIYFRGTVLWFALIHADEVIVAEDSYNSYHKEATEAYKARLKGNMLTASESSKNE
jgi:hypothetical protein